jgi:hypothetical protein
MKKSNLECFLYILKSYKRKHQWTIRSTGREKRKHTYEVPYCSTTCREVKGREIIRERDPERKSSMLEKQDRRAIK